MGYLLSIVVPTKDRYYYLKHLISLIKSFESDEIELIIQDNTADNNEILPFIKDLNYDNLKYFHTKEQISVSENSTRAIQNSTGEYVCFIGDDDGVTRHIVDCVKWMKKENIEILKSEYALYKWPSFPNGRMKLSSTISFHKYSGKTTCINNKEALVKLLRTGITGLREMPKVYNGIVKRSTIDKIYEKTGTFFPGSSPDMGNAVALCFVADNYTYIDFPIIIGGICSTGGGNILNSKKGYKELNEVLFLPKGIEERWYSKLPKVWTTETIWPQSAIESLKSMEESKYIKCIDDDLLQALLILHHPNLKDVTMRVAQNKNRVSALIWRYTIIKKWKGIKELLAYYLFGKYMGYMKIYRNIDTIQDAEKLLSTHYSHFIFMEKNNK